MDTLEAKKDFQGAVAAQAQLHELKQRASAISSLVRAEAVPWSDVSADTESARLVKLLEEQLRTKQTRVDELVQSKDFQKAAAAQAEVSELQKTLAELPVLDEQIRLITLNTVSYTHLTLPTKRIV